MACGALLARCGGMKRTLALVIAIASTSGCASTYWVSADDARRADRGGYSEREGVPATRETDGKAVHLRPSTIDGQLARIGEAPVRVRPRTTGARTAGYIMLGIGGALASVPASPAPPPISPAVTTRAAGSVRSSPARRWARSAARSSSSAARWPSPVRPSADTN
jgi:hypothetical protein